MNSPDHTKRDGGYPPKTSPAPSAVLFYACRGALLFVIPLLFAAAPAVKAAVLYAQPDHSAASAISKFGGYPTQSNIITNAPAATTIRAITIFATESYCGSISLYDTVTNTFVALFNQQGSNTLGITREILYTNPAGYTLTPGHSYSITLGCNSRTGTWNGSPADVYGATVSQAGHSIPGWDSWNFTANADVADYGFVVCDTVDCTFPQPQRPDPVVIVPGILGSWKRPNGEWQLDPILHTYDNLYEALQLAGYEKDKTLFFLGYDFRQDNVISAGELKQKIAEIKTICQCAKVDIVAHSMGGLMARQYVESNDYANDVDQLVFLGTPHKGAPNAYLAWEGGELGAKLENFGFSAQDLILKKLFSYAAKREGYSNIFDYIQHHPVVSTRQLLPIYSYIIDESSAMLRVYPYNYPVNAFLENLNSQSNLAELFSRTRTTNIVATSTKETVGGFSVVGSQSLPKWEHGYPNDFYSAIQFRGMFFEDGDTTVPLKSAIDFGGKPYISYQSNHLNLVTDAQSTVIKELTGQMPASEVRTRHIPIKALMIQIFSPVSVEITDPQGKRVGVDPASNSEVNEIDSAFYSGIGADEQFFFIPDPLDGGYKVDTVGTGTGEYTITTSYLSESGEKDVSVSGNTAPNLEINYNLNFSSQNHDVLSVALVDSIPPTTTLSVSGANGSNGWFMSDVSVSLAADDNPGGVGVFKTEYSLDGGTSWNAYTSPFAFSTEGRSQFMYRSQDFVGNIEAAKSFEVKIDKTPPEAELYFDAAKKTLTIEGVDVAAPTNVSRSGNIYTVKDEAGHTLTLIFRKFKQEEKEIDVELAGLQYDNNPPTLPSYTEWGYEWSVDKSGFIKGLTQQVEIKNKFDIEAHYNKSVGRTTLSIENEQTGRKQKIGLNGLVVVVLSTTSGNLNFSY